MTSVYGRKLWLHKGVTKESTKQVYLSINNLNVYLKIKPNSSFLIILLIVYPIPSHLLQAISPAVVPALTHIINKSIHTGIFPSAFKQARITPLLKKPTLNPTLLRNYRPVSCFPFIAKTLEQVLFIQVAAFLTQNNLLDSNQSGFRSGHSTETALHYLLITYLAGSVCCFCYGQPPDPPVNPIGKGHLNNLTPVV